MNKEKTGTREWSDVSYNIGFGCSHNCRYCYAKANALRFGRIKTSESWKKESLVNKRIFCKQKKMDGVIMFPTSHDLTDFYIKPAKLVLRELLRAGNKVLVVTKAHLAHIKDLCVALGAFKDSVEFRITITGMDKVLAKFWEVNAPEPAERLEALKYAHSKGFKTSVSCEPIIGSLDGCFSLYRAVIPFATNGVWFGRMNSIRRRVNIVSQETEYYVKRIEEEQTDYRLAEFGQWMIKHENVMLKDSIRRLL